VPIIIVNDVEDIFTLTTNDDGPLPDGKSIIETRPNALVLQY